MEVFRGTGLNKELVGELWHDTVNALAFAWPTKAQAKITGTNNITKNILFIFFSMLLKLFYYIFLVKINVRILLLNSLRFL
jgi:hypothetical protein